LSQQIATVPAPHKGRYGAPRLQDALAERGDPQGVQRLARLLKAAGRRGLGTRRFGPQTTDRDPAQPSAPNRLAERPAPPRPNQTWVPDLTCVRTGEGGLDAAVRLELGRRRGVGWATGEPRPARLAARAFQRPIPPRRPGQGLLPQSDRGVPSARRDWRGQREPAGRAARLSRRGHP